MLRNMTTVVESWPEPNTEEIARRLRMHMGDVKLSRNKLAMACGIGRTALSTKLDGQVDFTMTEVVAISKALGKSWLWILTGEEFDDGPNGDGGGFGPVNPTPNHPIRRPGWQLITCADADCAPIQEAA
jgi:hypothetical protein